jgi:hypothetical protein
MLGNGGERNGEGVGDVGDPHWPVFESIEHFPADRVAQGPIGAVQSKRRSFNHLVEH